uniref:AB hydrolase-1 domain-containing protein n=1 Tax=Astatotilapia calliptera TaxID=8154 RepID=A0AAX7SLM8_ASTCA
MADKKAILFNFWGVAVSARRAAIFKKLEEWAKTFTVSLHAFCCYFTDVQLCVCVQMIPALEAECVQEARDRSVTLPADWSVKGLLDKLTEAMMDVQAAVLKTAAGLRRSGLLTAVLANHWVDDRAAGDGTGRLLSLLGGHFDLVLQSCHLGHRVPEPAMFSSALQRLGVTPKQALWLDADVEGVKAAEGAGMKAVLVENLDAALEKLSEFTVACSPDEVSHGYITIKPGVRTHYVEMGSGPPVLLCHGFPESWYSWRYQIPALAAAGFRVLALDMKGYGESTAPPDIEEYSHEELCKSIPQVTLVGHDWGGSLVWAMARFYPERIRAVASLNTPMFKLNPLVPAFERLKAIPIFDYQVYFQTPGVAEAELEKDLERTFKIFFSSSSEAKGRPPLSTAGVCARGGLFVGLPEQIPRSSMLTEADLQYYVSQYKERGFRLGPLNWYRNSDANWKWMCSRPFEKLLMPTMMLTAGKDPVLLPSFTKGMEDSMPNLTRGHIEECGHWTQMEKPAETNKILISWLKEAHKKTEGGTVAPKL